MTPLANAIMKELLLPEDRKTFEDRDNLMHKLSDAHTFEISQINEVVDDLHQRMAWSLTKPDGTLDLNREGEGILQGNVLAFLPAPKTWIEWKEEWEEGEIVTTGVLVQKRHEQIAIRSPRWRLCAMYSGHEESGRNQVYGPDVVAAG
jgi:hypothetical protein